MFHKCLGWCASVEIMKRAPRALAVRIRLAPRSRRSGLALISSQTPRRTASSTMRSKSNGNASRCSRMRPVGWPSTRREGHSSARSNRPVISADSIFMWLCTLPMTRSSSASASCDRSIAPSFRMSHSRPEKTRNPSPLRLSSRTWAANATTRFSSRPLVMASDLEYMAITDHSKSLAVGHGQRLGMIRDSHVFVTALAGGGGHLFQGRAPVALGGMHVHIAADVRQLDQLGQAVFGGALDLAQVFAQLRRNPAQTQCFVDAGFGFARHLGFVRAAIQAVLAQLEAHLHRARADGHVVVLAAGEVLQRRAEAFARQRAHVHL